MSCDFPHVVVFCHINFRSFCKIKIQCYNFGVHRCTEFNKTITPFALVGYEISYSQLGPTGHVGYLSSHIQRALME